MTDFIIKNLPYGLSAHAGLAFIGKYLKRIKLNSLVDSTFPVRSGGTIATSSNATWACCVWARMILMLARTFGAMISSSALWGLAVFPRVLPCVSVWMPTPRSGLTLHPK